MENTGFKTRAWKLLNYIIIDLCNNWFCQNTLALCGRKFLHELATVSALFKGYFKLATEVKLGILITICAQP